ncbi:MAG: class I SAM-dependent methyltransferase [Caldilineaceae bacterium]|nr:class I SAM-dependent methyltransferase [Caldilineaceae bacterium]
MNLQTQQQLLALNKDFYATVAEPFNATRLAPSMGKSQLVKRLPLKPGSTIADIGCGNGRLAWLLNERCIPLDYTGVDANEQLLTFAQEHTASLRHVRTRFVCADLAQPDWTTRIARPTQGFRIVTCLATLHHLPGYDLRQTVMQGLAELVMPGGVVAISTWQFLTSPRFTAKLVDWREIGIDPAQVEPGDALLPWQQGGYAVRYLHQLDREEVMALASHAGLRMEGTYLADGKEGNLNLYALLRRPEQ